jgi:hypothetical protein
MRWLGDAIALGRDSHIGLVDPVANVELRVGDTNYSGWGIYVQLYNFNTASYEIATAFGGTTDQYKEYRISLIGTQLIVERGDTLTNITETYALTMPRDFVSNNSYINIGTGGCDGYYSPADFDWIRASTAK